MITSVQGSRFVASEVPPQSLDLRRLILQPAHVYPQCHAARATVLFDGFEDQVNDSFGRKRNELGLAGCRPTILFSALIVARSKSAMQFWCSKNAVVGTVAALQRFGNRRQESRFRW